MTNDQQGVAVLEAHYMGLKFRGEGGDSFPFDPARIQFRARLDGAAGAAREDGGGLNRAHVGSTPDRRNLHLLPARAR